MRRVFLILILACISLGLSSQSISAGDRADMKAATNKLAAKIMNNVEYDNANLSEVVKAIAREAGVKIIVSKGVRKEELNVTLDLNNIKAWSVLKIVLDEHDLKLQFSHGVFFVRTQEEAAKKVVVKTHIYDIRDIVMKIKNFKAPKINLAGSDENARIQNVDDDEEDDNPPSDEEVMELLQKHVEPDLWGTGKHRMSIFKKQLVVATSAEVHRKVANFLAQLRSSR